MPAREREGRVTDDRRQRRYQWECDGWPQNGALARRSLGSCVSWDVRSERLGGLEAPPSVAWNR